MVKSVHLSESLEDYVETIFVILAEKKAVRARDIAERMAVTRPSVTGALQALAREGLVNYEPYDVITLTAKGETAARDVLKRHETLKEFFSVVLGLGTELAETTACSVEHAMSSETVKRLATFVDHVKSCPQAQKACLKKRVL